jgi:hypothetical protein
MIPSVGTPGRGYGSLEKGQIEEKLIYRVASGLTSYSAARRIYPETIVNQNQY